METDEEMRICPMCGAWIESTAPRSQTVCGFCLDKLHGEGTEQPKPTVEKPLITRMNKAL